MWVKEPYSQRSLRRNGSVPARAGGYHTMTPNHRGAEEARRAHNPKDG